MSSFASDIRLVCLASFGVLALYTLFLSRYRGLDGHLTVRWLLVIGIAFITIAFWPWLPLYRVTSSMQERELLLAVTVVLFSFVTFLVLDLLVRSSRQSQQIKRLTQELAIQRMRMDSIIHPDEPPPPMLKRTDSDPSEKPKYSPWTTALSVVWIAACLSYSWIESNLYDSEHFPLLLKRALSAAYLE